MANNKITPPNNFFSNLLPAITNALWHQDASQPNGQGGILPTITNAATNNPVSHFLFGNAINTAQDIGTGLGNMSLGGKPQQAMNDANAAATQAANRAQTTTDPAEAARLRKVAGNTYANNANQAQQTAQSFSPDVQQNPLLRAGVSAMQIGSGADILAHPVQAVKGTIDLAKGALNAVRHPIQTLDAAGKTIDALPEIVNSEIHNPMNFKLDKTPNGLQKLGNRWLLGQYKNADAVSKDPLGVVTTLKDYGLSSPQSISDASKVITGAPDETAPLQSIVHKKVLNAVANADPVDVSGIFKNSLGNMEDSTNVTGAMETKAVNTVRKGLMNLGGFDPENAGMLQQEMEKGGDVALNAADPKKTFEFTRKLDQLSSTAYNAAYDKAGNLTNPAQRELGQFYSNVSGELKNRLFTGATADPAVTRLGADNMGLSRSWTPEEIAAFKKIGNGKIANDIVNINNIGDLRKVESLFTQGGRMADNVISAGEKSPSLTQMATALSTAMHPNPIGPGVFAASTNIGKEAIGNSLDALGNITAGAPSATLKGSIATQALLPTITNSKNQNSDNNKVNQSTGTIPQIASNVNTAPPTPITKIPTSQDQITPDKNGHLGVYDSFGPNGVASSTLKQGQQIADINSQIAKIEGQTSYKYDPKAQAQVAALNTTLQSLSDQYKLGYSQLAQPQAAALSTANLYNSAHDLLQQADPSILSANDTFDKLKTITTGPYSKLALYAHSLEQASGIPIFVKGMNKDVLQQNLLAASQVLMWKNYYAGLNVYSGGQQPTNNNTPTATPTLPPSTGSVQADQKFSPIQTALPPIQ